MEITYYIKNVYGNETIYAADDDKASAIRQISGQKTLTPDVINGLKKLGFTFQQVLPVK